MQSSLQELLNIYILHETSFHSALYYNFSKVGFRFAMPAFMAIGTSLVWRAALFQIAVYRSPISVSIGEFELGG